MDVRVGLWRKLSTEELMVLNCGVGEDSWESLGLQGDPTSPFWDFFGRNDAKAETPVLWPPHEKSWLFGKDFDAGRDWGQEEKGMTEDEMAGWHHRLDGCGFEWTPGVGDGQGGLVCCNSWGCKESDTTEQLNWTELLGRKVMTNLDSILKSRDYFANKGPPSQSYGFSNSHVWMWELDHKESWGPKNWCFELWCWRRLLRVLWTARRSNQSILKEISPECSLEGLMVKLKLQYFGYQCEELTH